MVDRDGCEGWWEAILLCKIFKINSYIFPIFSGEFLFFSYFLGAQIPIFLLFWPFLLLDTLGMHSCFKAIFWWKREMTVHVSDRERDVPSYFKPVCLYRGKSLLTLTGQTKQTSQSCPNVCLLGAWLRNRHQAPDPSGSRNPLPKCTSVHANHSVEWCEVWWFSAPVYAVPWALFFNPAL